MVEDVWCIIRRNQKMLRAIGVNKAYDFCQLSKQRVIKNMIKVGSKIKNDQIGLLIDKKLSKLDLKWS